MVFYHLARHQGLLVVERDLERVMLELLPNVIYKLNSIVRRWLLGLTEAVALVDFSFFLRRHGATFWENPLGFCQEKERKRKDRANSFWGCAGPLKAVRWVGAVFRVLVSCHLTLAPYCQPSVLA